MDLLYLPPEVLLHIMSYLPFPDWQKFRRLSVDLYALSSYSWKDVSRLTFSGIDEAKDGEEFKALTTPFESGPYHLFLSLDDLPVVRYAMGGSQIFVLSVDIAQLDNRRFLKGQESCLYERAVGQAPWGDFEFIYLHWGSLFSAFSFYRHTGIHSVYLASFESRDLIMGTMHSGWNDVTGTYLWKKEEEFKQNLRENSWGDSFADFHSAPNKGPLYAISGSTFKFEAYRCTEDDMVNLLSITVEAQNSHAFLGHAAGSWGRNGEAHWGRFKMRGSQQQNGAVAILLELEEQAGGESCAIMLMGQISPSLVIQGCFVEDVAQRNLCSGTFTCTPLK